jgi:hypothetical protein
MLLSVDASVLVSMIWIISLSGLLSSQGCNAFDADADHDAALTLSIERLSLASWTGRRLKELTATTSNAGNAVCCARLASSRDIHSVNSNEHHRAAIIHGGLLTSAIYRRRSPSAVLDRSTTIKSPTTNAALVCRLSSSCLDRAMTSVCWRVLYKTPSARPLQQDRRTTTTHQPRPAPTTRCHMSSPGSAYSSLQCTK